MGWTTESTIFGVPTTVADKIRRYRDRNFFTQRQLADQIGVGINSIKRWERGDIPSTLFMYLLKHKGVVE